MAWQWIPDGHTHVCVKAGYRAVIVPDWDAQRSKLMNRYVTAIRLLITQPDGPDELGIRQLIEELNADSEMYSAVWAHLDGWMRSWLKDHARQRTDIHPAKSG